MTLDSWTQHKRYRVTIVALILLAAFGLIGVILKLETAISIAIGGIPTVAIAYIAGDSYRPSSYRESYYREEYNYDSNGDMVPPGKDPDLFA